MKKTTILSILAVAIISLTSFTTSAQKLVSSTTHFKFFSSTPAEDIQANNYKAVGTIETSTGNIVFSVPMQSFEFEKALMQKHYNSAKFLDTKQFPKSKFKGQITNLDNINFEVDGTYNATVIGEMTLHGITKPITETATITVAGNKITIETKMQLTLAGYNINFKKGKPSTNIAKTIAITSKSVYTKGG